MSSGGSEISVDKKVGKMPLTILPGGDNVKLDYVELKHLGS